MVTLDRIGKAITIAAEDLIRRAMTEGVDGISSAVMEPAQYTPEAAPEAASGSNRAIAAGVVQALRTNPLPLASHTVATLPAAIDWPGCLVYVNNGAAGFPVLAFSDGIFWVRCDTLAAVSPI